MPRYFSGICMDINMTCDKKYIPMTHANTNPNKSADTAPAAKEEKIWATVFKKVRTLLNTTKPINTKDKCWVQNSMVALSKWRLHQYPNLMMD